MNPVVTCGNCGVKLRLRATALPTVDDVTCTKCNSRIPIPEELKQAAAKSVTQEPAPTPEPVARTDSITFSCEKCGKTTVVRADLKGKRIRCNSCREVIVVPDPEASRGAAAGPATPPASPTPPKPPRKGKAEKKAEEAGGKDFMETRHKDATVATPPEPPPASEPAAAASRMDEARVAALEEEVRTLKDRIEAVARLLARYADSSSDAASMLADALKAHTD